MICLHPFSVRHLYPAQTSVITVFSRLLQVGITDCIRVFPFRFGITLAIIYYNSIFTIPTVQINFFPSLVHFFGSSATSSPARHNYPLLFVYNHLNI